MILAAIAALGLTAAPGRASARGKDPDLGLVITKDPGRRPSKGDLKKFEKALRKALTKEEGWTPTSAKQASTLFETDRGRAGWRCRPGPVRPEDVGPDGRVLREDELFCAVDVIKGAGLGRVLLVHLRWSDDAYNIDMHDVGKVVGRTTQRVTGSIAGVVEFAPALARRAMKELGGFRVQTNIEGADVNMDGMFLGRTPLEQSDMAPGSYKLKITADGFFAWEGDAEVTAGEMNRIDVALKQPRTSAPPPTFSPSSDTLRWGLVGVGVVAAVGGVALAASSSDPTTRTAGIALFAVGAGGAVYAFTYAF